MWTDIKEMTSPDSDSLQTTLDSCFHFGIMKLKIALRPKTLESSPPTLMTWNRHSLGELQRTAIFSFAKKIGSSGKIRWLQSELLPALLSKYTLLCTCFSNYPDWNTLQFFLCVSIFFQRIPYCKET